MNYDFQTKVSRKGQGSAKWLDMYQKKPDVSEGVVPLSVADMEFKNPPEIIEGLKEYLDEVILGYTVATEEYLESVCRWMEKRHQFHVEPEWIVNTAGVVPAFFNGIQEFTKEGEGVIVMSPVYYPFFNAIQLQNRQLVDCPLIEEEGHYRMDLEKFKILAQDPKNKILLFCSPHNPVGRVWQKEELEALGQIIIEEDLILFSDEIHFDLVMPGYKHLVFQTLSEELADRTITFTAPSKTFNLAGMGLSNIIIKNPHLRNKFRQGLEKTSTAPMTALGYKACQLGYDYCEQWLEQCLKVIDTNQRLVHDFFKEKYPHIKAPLIEGTYLQWVDFRKLGLSGEELEEFMVEKAELFLDEGYIFGTEGEGFERINLAAPTFLIEEALNRLDKALSQEKKDVEKNES